MCNYTKAEYTETMMVIWTFTAQQINFTGYDVYQKSNKHNTPEYISSLVRELYNNGEIPGYSSVCTNTEINPRTGKPFGPLLYFPTPKEVSDTFSKYIKEV